MKVEAVADDVKIMGDKFTLMDLPYDRKDLEPFMSRETLDFHYGKHHKTYVDTLNKLIKGSEYETMSLKEILAPAMEMAKGYPIEAQAANGIERQKERIEKWPYSKQVFLVNQGDRRAPYPGEIFVQSDLYNTLNVCNSCDYHFRISVERRIEILFEKKGKYFSFPSNHAANSAALATVFSMIYPHLRFILWGLAITVMFSRVYIGVHYPLDIISGGMLGTIYGLLLVKGWDHFMKNSFATNLEQRGS